MEELGSQRILGKGWDGKALDRLASERKSITKDEREQVLWATIKHYTHLAHHASSEGGVSAYSRSEAQFTLALAAAAVARVRAS